MNIRTFVSRPALRAAAWLIALVLAGCANVTKVASGEVVVRDRLALTVERDWNQFERGLADDTPTWTIEGITVDALKFYVGIRDGALIAPTPTGGKGTLPLAFRSGMGPADVVALFQGLFTRDGSLFALEKLEPTSFAGGPGFRFDYSLVRKVDDVRLRGTAWGTVRGGELFLVDYSAPRLGFFPRHAAQVERMVGSARIRS